MLNLMFLKLQFRESPKPRNQPHFSSDAQTRPGPVPAGRRILNLRRFGHDHDMIRL